MTLDQIDQILRQANPVPDLTVLEPVEAPDLLIDRRRTEMETDDRVEVEFEAERPKRAVIVGIAAAVIVVIGALILFQLQEEGPVADQPAVTQPVDDTGSAVEIATGFMEAYASYDVEGAAAYLSPEALETEFQGVEGLSLDTRLRRAEGYKHLVSTCEEIGSSTSLIQVRCPFAYHGLHTDELGMGPYEGSAFILIIEDGKVRSILENVEFIENGFSGEMWEPFSRWVTETYPDDAAIMYTPGGVIEAKTEDSIPLWEQRSREYVEVLWAAVTEYIARAEQICTEASAQVQAAWDAAGEGLSGENHNEMFVLAAAILEDALTDLRSEPPPEPVRGLFERDYALLEEENRWLRDKASDPGHQPAAHHISVGLEGCTVGG